MSLLLLNTILAQGSFQLEKLQQRHTALTHRVEALQQDVTYESSPELLAKKARSLGMVPSGKPHFVDTEKSGRGPARQGPGGAGR